MQNMSCKIYMDHAATTEMLPQVRKAMEPYLMEEYGTIRIKLDELIEKAGISKNKLSHKAEMQRTQINAYCNNQITRLDIDVLSRICTVLECSIGDLLEFIPPKKAE